MSAAENLPIVFVHGIRLSGSMWNTVLPELAGQHRLLAPDLPGHGVRRGEPFTLEAALDAVAASIDRLGGRALVVGLSLGGFVGIACAARHPSRVAGLVAMGCTTQPAPLSAAPYRLVGSIAKLRPELAARLSEHTLRRVLPRQLADACVAGGQSCEVISAVVAALSRRDYVSALASYPGKVWLMNGSRDPFRWQEQRFVRACVDGELVVVPNAGHLTTLVDHAGLARRLHAWAEQVAPSAAQPSSERTWAGVAR